VTSLDSAFRLAREKLQRGDFAAADLEELWAQVRPQPQRLLYLYALQPTVRASLVAATLQEQKAATHCQIDPLAEDLPYRSVLEAMADGWRVIHFPDHRAPYQEGRLDMLGYEFVLEKYGA